MHCGVGEVQNASSVLHHPTCQGRFGCDRLRCCLVLRNNIRSSKPGLADLQHIFMFHNLCSNALCDVCSHRSGKHIAYPLFGWKVEFRIHFNVILLQTLTINILFIIIINSGNARRVKIVKNLHSYNCYGRDYQKWRFRVCRQRITVQKTRVTVIHGS